MMKLSFGKEVLATEMTANHPTTMCRNRASVYIHILIFTVSDSQFSLCLLHDLHSASACDWVQPQF
jgi:hypothetical protein